MSTDLRVATGTLLAASPSLLDPNFMHSLSVICEHTDQGAFGIVVNKPSSLTVDRLLPEHPVFGKLALPVWWGGPVGNDTLQVLHRIPELGDVGHEIGDGLRLGVHLDDLEAFAAGRDPRETVELFRFVLGYAGWGAGQLEGELAEGSWLPIGLDPELVFGYEQEPVWQSAVRSLGGEDGGLAVMPPELGWN